MIEPICSRQSAISNINTNQQRGKVNYPGESKLILPYSYILNIMSSKLLFSLIIILTGSELFAQTAASKPDFPQSYYNILAIGLLTILVAIIMGFFIFGMGEGKEKPKVVKESLFAKIKQKLTASVPLEKEEEIVLEHDFDGIKELDNRVPPWFSYLFYITIIFSVIYMLDYHVFSSDKLMYDEYAEEMKIAAEQRAALEKTGAFVTEETVVALNDAVSVQSGQKIYEINCVACHAASGGGLVGPNLTDDYWIHGGGIKNVFKVIKYGVPAKGMISWQTQLNPKQIQEVASYILTMHGTNPPNAKQPEGEKYVPQDSLSRAAL
ncbi:MAG: cbb3-type cytochrome c oxidase N-terminal domain-containing protein [Ignavibacteriaceae bacterium]